MTTQVPSPSVDMPSKPSIMDRLYRLIRHGWLGDSSTRSALPEHDVERITQAVARSELRHTAQIRICVESSLPPSYAWQPLSTDEISRARALRQFSHLRVWDTEHNNGVLIYLLLAEHTIEIVADRGINKAIPASAWGDIVEHMRTTLCQGNAKQDTSGGCVAVALIQAIDDVSGLLEGTFPRSASTSGNELPDAPHID